VGVEEGKTMNDEPLTFSEAMYCEFTRWLKDKHGITIDGNARATEELQAKLDPLLKEFLREEFGKNSPPEELEKALDETFGSGDAEQQQ
jgi:hypothetical protein